MERPCLCDKLPPEGELYTIKYCRVCWLYHHDPRYRELWGGDPGEVIQVPSIFQKAVNFGQAALRHAATGFQQVSEEEYQRRLEVCQGCEFFRNNSCMKCGCQVAGSLLSKARWASSVCPEKKW